jgi:hypothetical protein
MFNILKLREKKKKKEAFIRYPKYKIFELFKYIYMNLQHRIKELSLFHNDAHNHKITVILKQLKIPRSLRHVSVHVGTIIREPFLCLAKTTVMILYPRRS